MTTPTIRSSAERSLCIKKNRYPSPAEAMNQLRRRRRVEKNALYAYACQQCGGYHLTKLKPPFEADLEKP